MMGWLSSWYFPPQKIPEEKPPGILDISGPQVVAGCVVHYCKVGIRGVFHPAVNIPNMNRMESTDGDGKSLVDDLAVSCHQFPHYTLDFPLPAS